MTLTPSAAKYSGETVVMVAGACAWRPSGRVSDRTTPPCSGTCGREGNRGHAGQAGGEIDQRPVELRRLCVAVPVAREVVLSKDHVPGVEPDVERVRTLQSAREKTGGDEQHQADGNLNDDKRLPHA